MQSPMLIYTLRICVQSSMSPLDNLIRTSTPYLYQQFQRIKGNEFAKKNGARLAETDNIEYNTKRDKREITKAMKRKAVKKWKIRYNLADSKGSIHEVFDEAGVRKCFGEKNRKIFSIVNQLIAGQPRLKHHLARLQIVEDSRCEHCSEEETSEHLMFVCTHYSTGFK